MSTNIESTENTESTAKFESLHMVLEKEGKELGAFYSYDATAGTPEIAGTRAVKCLYKVAEGKERTHSNSYVLLPTSHITEEVVTERIAELAPYLVSYLQEIEDKEIKKQHREHASRIYTEYLSLDKIIEALEASEKGGRLNAEMVGKWFEDSIQDTLILSVANKLGYDSNPTEAERAKIIQYVTAYRKKFESLASPKTLFNDSDKEAVKRIIQLAEASDTVMGKRFISRIDGMKEKEADALLAL